MIDNLNRREMLHAVGICLDRWDAMMGDAQWQCLGFAKQAGIIKAVPPKSKFALVLP